jgi:hypothetical protein
MGCCTGFYVSAVNIKINFSSLSVCVPVAHPVNFDHHANHLMISGPSD